MKDKLNRLDAILNELQMDEYLNEDSLPKIGEARGLVNDIVKNCSIPLVRSCYAVIDEEDNVVQLYQTEKKANEGLNEFRNSHPHTTFYVDTMQIN